jgi:hypothetical protein
VVAISQHLEDELIWESRADVQSLVNRSAYHSSQQRIKHVKPPLVNTENYQHYQENGIKSVRQTPVSTFSIDVDTGSYTNIRRVINQGMFPPADAIRIEVASVGILGVMMTQTDFFYSPEYYRHR